MCEYYSQNHTDYFHFRPSGTGNCQGYTLFEFIWPKTGNTSGNHRKIQPQVPKGAASESDKWTCLQSERDAFPVR